jgi:hypothetical protein
MASTAWWSCMFVSPNSWTVSSPSNTAVGISTGFSNLFGMLSSSLATEGFYAFSLAMEEEGYAQLSSAASEQEGAWRQGGSRRQRAPRRRRGHRG